MFQALNRATLARLLMKTHSATTSPITVRVTTSKDLLFVIQTERHPDNAPYIGQWSEARHRDAIASPNEAHFIIEIDAQPIGYLILTGLNDVHEAINLRRIVIVPKGKGYGRAVLRWVKLYTFESLQFHRLWFDVIDTNERAKMLYLSEGFTIEGTMRESWKTADGYKNMLLLSMLAFDYAQATAAK